MGERFAAAEEEDDEGDKVCPGEKMIVRPSSFLFCDPFVVGDVAFTNAGVDGDGFENAIDFGMNCCC